MNKLRTLAIGLVALAATGTANATVIGVAVDGVGSNNTVGSVNGDGSINFYAPLSADSSGTYGVDAGLSTDTCYYPTTCTGGTLDMFLRFEPAPTGDGILALTFLDLDIAGANDPWFFFESLRLADESNNTLYEVDSVLDGFGDPNLAILANNTVQLLLSFVDIAASPFFLQLSFSTDFHALTPYGGYQNTVETMLATLTPVSVPEPATLSLLGTGLVAFGLSRRRKRNANAA
jgi:hypothetical protein